MIYEPAPRRPKSKSEERRLAALRADPTRIKINVDPTVKRMKGVTRHGNTPFDVPIISEIAPNLWQGGCQNGLVLPAFIDHIISLYPWEEYTIAHELGSNLAVKMFDNEEQGFEMVDTIAHWVNECRKTGVVLVHCQAGLNRSSLIAGRALMLSGMTADEAIRTLRTNRSPACLCNPAFEKWLRDYDTASQPAA